MNIWQDITPLINIKFGNLETIQVIDDVLYIKIDSNSQKMIISFRSFLSYQLTFESYALKILSEHNLDGKSWMFKSEKGDFYDWFNNQNYGIYAENISTYRLIFFHHIVEVLSDSFPEIQESS
ncbi:hypothetical protein MBO_08122 [Moraxella bovoculi 237]|uniref:Uncharacterized protein n=1 Tax=Moraxella bovoculi 237 TaxID=743974 RepID=A0A066UC08_9GAMM|nr:hypothetical protein [Moraxella bovoculi]KDN24635.1 hypothetical protein MBO_08122 [Moraxella bovoculi 237]